MTNNRNSRQRKECYSQMVPRRRYIETFSQTDFDAKIRNIRVAVAQLTKINVTKAGRIGARLMMQAGEVTHAMWTDYVNSVLKVILIDTSKQLSKAVTETIDEVDQLKLHSVDKFNEFAQNSQARGLNAVQQISETFGDILKLVGDTNWSTISRGNNMSYFETSIDMIGTRASLISDNTITDISELALRHQ